MARAPTGHRGRLGCDEHGFKTWLPTGTRPPKSVATPVTSTNSKIRLISHRAFGFHSADPLIALVYLCCTGLTIELPR